MMFIDIKWLKTFFFLQTTTNAISCHVQRSPVAWTLLGPILVSVPLDIISKTPTPVQVGIINFFLFCQYFQNSRLMCWVFFFWGGVNKGWFIHKPSFINVHMLWRKYSFKFGEILPWKNNLSNFHRLLRSRAYIQQRQRPVLTKCSGKRLCYKYTNPYPEFLESDRFSYD